ncbi:MAG: orotate phosphoribosyltransferase [Candidatus ainarchaeum sp.]|nr:orotate phosphoribosyltransferase [Candidatus ainarchaeum sp.]
MAGEIAGLCFVCGRPGSMNSCRLCGALACDRHYDARAGVCSDCAKGRR